MLEIKQSIKKRFIKKNNRSLILQSQLFRQEILELKSLNCESPVTFSPET